MTDKEIDGIMLSYQSNLLSDDLGHFAQELRYSSLYEEHSEQIVEIMSEILIWSKKLEVFADSLEKM